MTEFKNEAIRNRLKTSQRFLSYLEKHRIYELFQELSSMLLIKKPDDHLLFLKQSIYHAARRLDAPRIIILSPPNCQINKYKLGEKLSKKLQIPLITLFDVQADGDSICETDPGYTVQNLRFALINYMKTDCDGWIFVDFPRTEEDARCLQRTGILPSHVIDIVFTGPKEFSLNPDYYKQLRGLRRVYSKQLTAIEVKSKHVKEIAEECLNLVKFRNYSPAPAIFRILLIDSVDLKRSKCLGQHIAQEFNIIHIDFNDVLKQICLQDTDLGDIIREICYKSQCLPIEIKIQAFEQFLLKSEGLRRGWVLTGFVNSVDDFKQLDMTDTPPNRVIMIVCRNQEDSEKTITCVNYNEISEQAPPDTEKKCPDKEKKCTCIPEQDIEELICYAGESANIIEDNDDLKVIEGKVEAYLMQPRLCIPPRLPRPPLVIKPEDIEFDPDDEPSTQVFDCIRAPEPKLPLI